MRFYRFINITYYKHTMLLFILYVIELMYFTVKRVKDLIFQKKFGCYLKY